MTLREAIPSRTVRILPKLAATLTAAMTAASALVLRKPRAIQQALLMVMVQPTATTKPTVLPTPATVTAIAAGPRSSVPIFLTAM